MEEKRKIISQINKVINYSQGYSGNIDYGDIVNTLYEKKSRFINMFGGLIYEFPEKMSFEIDNREKEKLVTDFCNHLMAAYNLYELSNFVYSNKGSFFENVVTHPYTSDSGIKINKNTKILRAFKYFIENNALLRRVQDEASMLIQKNKVSGTVCLSVHPLDFLSSSENNNNWRSCHALDGEFRAGNLSYMLDSCTFMLYMKTDKDEILPNFPSSVPWNNKIWRCLMFLSDTGEMMFAGRQYPFSIGNSINEIIKLTSTNIRSFGRWTNFCDKKINSFKCDENLELEVPRHIVVGDRIIPMKELVTDADKEYPLHFNDLLKSSCYDAMYAYKIDPGPLAIFGETSVLTKRNTRFKIGGEVKCPCCKNNKITLPESMLCIDCEEMHGSSESESFEHCDYCGRRFYFENGYYVEYEEETVCPQCYERHVISCGVCGTTAYEGSDYITYDEEFEDYMCDYCRREREEDC